MCVCVLGDFVFWFMGVGNGSWGVGLMFCFGVF